MNTVSTSIAAPCRLQESHSVSLNAKQYTQVASLKHTSSRHGSPSDPKRICSDGNDAAQRHVPELRPSPCAQRGPLTAERTTGVLSRNETVSSRVCEKSDAALAASRCRLLTSTRGDVPLSSEVANTTHSSFTIHTVHDNAAHHSSQEPESANRSATSIPSCSELTSFEFPPRDEEVYWQHISVLSEVPAEQNVSAGTTKSSHPTSCASQGRRRTCEELQTKALCALLSTPNSPIPSIPPNPAPPLQYEVQHHAADTIVLPGGTVHSPPTPGGAALHTPICGDDDEYPATLMLWRAKVSKTATDSNSSSLSTGTKDVLQVGSSIEEISASLKHVFPSDRTDRRLHAVARVSDMAVLRGHSRDMFFLKQEPTTNGTLRLQHDLDRNTRASQQCRGRLQAMNAAEDVRRNALVKIRLENALTTIFDDERKTRNFLDEQNSVGRRLMWDQFQASRLAACSTVIAAKEEKSRKELAQCYVFDTNALNELKARDAEISMERTRTRQEMLRLQTVDEPFCRRSATGLEADERKDWAAEEVTGRYTCFFSELLRDELRDRELLRRFESDVRGCLARESLLSSAAAAERESSRLALQQLIRNQGVLNEAEANDRSGIESVEQTRLLCIMQMHSYHKQILMSMEALRERERVERLDVLAASAAWSEQISSEMSSSWYFAKRCTCIREEVEARASQFANEESRRRELLSAEKKSAADANEALRKRLDAERHTLQLAHQEERVVFSQRATSQLGMMLDEELYVREELSVQFREERDVILEQQRSTEMARFLSLLAEQRAAFCCAEHEGRVDHVESAEQKQWSVLLQAAIHSVEAARFREMQCRDRLTILDEQVLVWRRDVEEESRKSLDSAKRRQEERMMREADQAAHRALVARAAASAPFLGFSLAEKVSTSTADTRLVNSAGIANLVVDSLIVGGPAFCEGLRLHDRIVSVDGGKQPTSLAAVRHAIAKGAKVGKRFEIVVRRSWKNETRSADGSSGREGSDDDDDDGDDASSVGSGSHQKQHTTLTFHIPVKTVLPEFESLTNVFFDLPSAQRLERESASPGYTTRTKRAFSEKVSPAGAKILRSQSFAVANTSFGSATSASSPTLVVSGSPSPNPVAPGGLRSRAVSLSAAQLAKTSTINLTKNTSKTVYCDEQPPVQTEKTAEYSPSPARMPSVTADPAGTADTRGSGSSPCECFSLGQSQNEVQLPSLSDASAVPRRRSTTMFAISFAEETRENQARAAGSAATRVHHPAVRAGVPKSTVRSALPRK